MVLVAAAVAFVGSGSGLGTARAASDNSVTVVDTTVPPGGTAVMDVMAHIDPATVPEGFGSYLFGMTWDPAVFTVDSISDGDEFITVWAQNIDNSAGTALFAGGQVVRPGPTGLLIVARVNIYGACSVTASSLVSLSIEQFYDPENQPILASAIAGTVTCGTVPQRPADLSIEMQDDTDPVMVGQQLTYTVTVSNHGPDYATNVELTDDLPGKSKKPKVVFLSATPSQGTCAAPANRRLLLVCDLEAIPAGETVVVLISVQPTDRAKGKLKNTVAVQADQRDPNRRDNRATESTRVLRH